MATAVAVVVCCTIHHNIVRVSYSYHSKEVVGTAGASKSSSAARMNDGETSFLMKRPSASPAQHRDTTTMDEESRMDFSSLGSVPVGAGANAGGVDYAAANTQERKHSVLRKQLHSFTVMSGPYFRENRQGKVLFAIMVILTLLNSAVRVFFSYLARDFWSALSDKDEATFYEIMIKFLISMIALAPITVAYRFQRQKLAIAWREVRLSMSSFDLPPLPP